ncbi:MAG: PspC domain-containing protein [Rhodothermales bacterium]
MSTRTRQSTRSQEQSYDEFEDSLDLDAFSEDELEEYLFEDEEGERKKPNGMFNLPTMAGLSMIVVGIIYMLQQLGVFAGGGFLASLVPMLPFIAGILIILLGFGVLSWRPKKKKRKTVQKTTKVSGKTVREPAKDKGKKRLRKSSDRKVFGVCGGIAEYFNLDPTLVRIAFVIGTIITNGGFLAAYLILAFVMGKSEPKLSTTTAKSKKLSDEERITIIRDS